jgi:phosphoenolpyruvate carboxykinase (GTP)
MPSFGDMSWKGLESMTPERFGELTSLDADTWSREVRLQSEFFEKLGDRLPPVFRRIQEGLISRLTQLRQSNDTAARKSEAARREDARI